MLPHGEFLRPYVTAHSHPENKKTANNSRNQPGWNYFYNPRMDFKQIENKIEKFEDLILGCNSGHRNSMRSVALMQNDELIMSVYSVLSVHYRAHLIPTVISKKYGVKAENTPRTGHQSIAGPIHTHSWLSHLHIKGKFNFSSCPRHALFSQWTPQKHTGWSSKH